MALLELSMLEQRYLAVREVLDTGSSVTDVATRHGVDRRTLHRWLLRYANEGMAALADKSSKPDPARQGVVAMVSHSYRSQSETRVPNFYKSRERGGWTRGRRQHRGQGRERDKGASHLEKREAGTDGARGNFGVAPRFRQEVRRSSPGLDRVATNAGTTAIRLATTRTPATSTAITQIGTTETGTTPR